MTSASHNEPQHVDKIGRELSVGDCVAYVDDNKLLIGTITRLNPKMILITEVGAKGFWARGVNRYPEDTIKLESPDLTIYILKLVK